MDKLICFFFCCACHLAICFAATTISNVPVTRGTLDSASLETLNRQLRKALLEKVTNELTEGQLYMDSLQPQIRDCQNQMNANLGQCAQCVDNECQRKFQQCPSMTIHFRSPGGTSVSTSTSNGRVKLTICSFMNGMFPSMTQTCNTIMNPAGYMVNSINQINDNLVINLQRMSGDLGNTAMGNFIGGLATVVNGYNNNANFSQMTPEESAAFQTSMQNMQTSLQQSMHNLNTNLNQMGVDLNHMGSAMGNWGHQFASALSNSMHNLFNGLFGGFRYKRQAVNCNVPLTELLRVCGGLTAQCSSCQGADTHNATQMQAVCGAPLINKVEAIEKSMIQLEQIMDEISTARNIIRKVEFDDILLDPQTSGYGGVVVTAKIRGKTVVINFGHNLEYRNLAGTASLLSQQVWKEWAVMMGNL